MVLTVEDLERRRQAGTYVYHMDQIPLFPKVVLNPVEST